MICDRCGLPYRFSDMQKEWNGLWVCPADYERRHPHDFQKIPKSRQRVAVARPRVEDTFIDDLTVTERKAKI